MLTSQSVRRQLDAIADEILESPGIYAELYTQLFSQRVREWMQQVPLSDARVIESVAELDPDYCADAAIPTPTYVLSAGTLFNPAWDVQY